MDSSNIQPPGLGQTQPVYPHLMQLLRPTSVAAGPAGTSLYNGFTQQLRADGTLLPRDRESCLVLDVNGQGLDLGTPAGTQYYLGRLAGAYNNLPVYEVTCCEPVVFTDLVEFKGPVLFDSSVTFRGNVTISGSTLFGNSVTFKSTSTFSGSTLFSNSVTIQSTLLTTASSTFQGTNLFTGPTMFLGPVSPSDGWMLDSNFGLTRVSGSPVIIVGGAGLLTVDSTTFPILAGSVAANINWLRFDSNYFVSFVDSTFGYMADVTLVLTLLKGPWNVVLGGIGIVEPWNTLCFDQNLFLTGKDAGTTLRGDITLCFGSGQIIVGQGPNTPASAETVAGDLSIDSSGVATVEGFYGKQLDAAQFTTSLNDQDLIYWDNGSSRWKTDTIEGRLTEITGYDATQTQVLTNVAGTIQWITVSTC